MKRSLLVAAALAAVLVAARLPAEDTTAPKMVKPDWHYRWHESRWWYWMPESKSWMVWSGSTWVPFEQFSASLKTHSVSQSTEAGDETAATAATATTGENCPITSSGTYSGGNYSGYSGGNYSGGGYSGSGGSNGSGYSGYGWSWGSGTAFRSGPGARF